MRIREFFIDRFGMLQSQHVPLLSPGLTVFLGGNEAGKSTCLNFFRAMFFGYARNRRSMDYFTDARASSGGGAGGGSLVLESGELGTVRLVRKPGPRGGVFSLTDMDGSPRPDADLSLLLRGCTPDLYDKVFAFSLGELAHFGSLADDNIRHALHGAAFGMGLRSPGQVLKELEENMRRIFAPRATTSRIQGLLRDLEALNTTVRERGNEVERYAELRAALDAAAAELAALRGERAALEDERRALERKIALRRRWEALREAEDALAACPGTPGTFSPDGRERLDRLGERLEDRQHALSAARFALERAEAEAGSLAHDPELTAASGAIFSLAERKESVRAGAARIQTLVAERESFARLAAAVCRDLGPGWDENALESRDLSLAAHDLRDTLGRRLGEAEQALLLARTEYERIEREGKAAQSALDEAREALSASGISPAGPGPADSPAGPPDEAALERLGQLLTRAEDAHEKTGPLALALRNAELALDQSIAAVDASWTRENLERAAVSPLDR
ncbi:MAG: AAA family ATPase, partial [Deltaproteobacteria bacterium]|nr:AAA family ATPase [Deltaproteobacteria bacterium]